MAFEARSIINGGKLKDFIGRNVSILTKVENNSGLMLKVKSTDGHSLRINLNESISARQEDWVEIMGVPVGHDAIKAKEIYIILGYPIL
ncbi:uncharacterized protein LOC129615229 isoform X2 [Condylostylus longicornis]|uniref:uncharacterized protein LOC129615229 isoform X2 n=1 Tax=Condylostylus longicornis TaxID=2530218 RepID=UPI00244E314E|nr:uncharacterized protein LOC129615229 isoform X2 [Condylostylus longicornis]